MGSTIGFYHVTFRGNDRKPVYLSKTDGLNRAGTALCHQVTTLDRSKLTQRMGELPSAMMKQVEYGLKAAMDME